MKSKLFIGFTLSSLIICASARASSVYDMLCNRTGYTGEYRHTIGLGFGVEGDCHFRLEADGKKYVKFDGQVCKPKYYEFTGYRSDGYFAKMQIYLFGQGDLGTALFRDKNNHLGTCLLKNRRDWVF